MYTCAFRTALLLLFSTPSSSIWKSEKKLQYPFYYIGFDIRLCVFVSLCEKNFFHSLNLLTVYYFLICSCAAAVATFFAVCFYNVSVLWFDLLQHIITLGLQRERSVRSFVLAWHCVNATITIPNAIFYQIVHESYDLLFFVVIHTVLMPLARLHTFERHSWEEEKNRIIILLIKLWFAWFSLSHSLDNNFDQIHAIAVL